MGKSLKIMFVSAEVAPYAKTGGLADVAGSLPQKLAEMGHDVRVVMPGYKEITAEQSYLTDFQVELNSLPKTCIARQIHGAVSTTYTLNNYHYYNRDGLYCHMDDGERFAFFCKASLELIKAIDFKPDIIHLNDWHTGPIALLLKEQYQKQDSFYQGIRTLFTIHNLEYQGHFGKNMLDVFGLPEELFVMEGVEFYGMFNFMKAGIVYSDKISTVSKAYGEEILTPRFGERLDGVLRSRQKDLYGILNGISYDVFNPAMDPFIPFPFDEKRLSGKVANRKALQKEMGLPVRDVPVIGVVHRLAAQKGLEMVLGAFDEMMKLDVQFILLGIGDPAIEDAFVEAMKKYPDSISTRIEFNEGLAHRIYAGSDIFLMPSIFEPCGLGQMISLHYGTIPVVRHTGGLKDTIVDIGRNSELGNGFTFSEMTAKAFFKTLKRAVETCRSDPGTWLEMVTRGLKSDFSWKNSAEKYVSAYLETLKG